MEIAFVIMFSVCASVLASVSVVHWMEKTKKNGYKKEEEKVNGEGNGNIIKLEEIAHKFVERERKQHGAL